MKLLVTGGAGFIGSNFIRYWLNKHPEDRILNFDSLTYAGNLENLAGADQNPNYSFRKGDIRSRDDVSRAMHGIDTVVHFAAESHVDRSILDVPVFMSTNILGTQVLLEESLKQKVRRFHHISTDEVFGALPLTGGTAFSETTRYDPRSPYSASKAGSDHLVRAYFHTYGLPVTITNCSNNYGPYQFPEKLIPLAITNSLEGKPVPLYGDGKYIRDWLYVEDHCRGIDLVISAGRAGETYCIGGLTDSISNLEVVRKILGLLGRDESSIKFVSDRPGHDRRYAVDWTKIREELGWKPETDFDTYLARTVTWYKEHRDWWMNVKSGQYREYYRKQYGSSS